MLLMKTQFWCLVLFLYQQKQRLCFFLQLLLSSNDIVFTPLQQAAHNQEVSEELRNKALQYSSECTNGYISLLEQVLQVRTGKDTRHEKIMEVPCVCGRLRGKCFFLIKYLTFLVDVL